jgi:acyl carrier protein
VTVNDEVSRISVQDAVRQILVTSVGLAPGQLEVAEDPTLEELGLDSLAALELQAVVQQRYGVKIPDESLEMTVESISGFVEDVLAEGN